MGVILIWSPCIQMAEPLTLLTNDIVQDIIKNLRPADLARLGMVDTRLRDISTVQMAEILASPTLTNVAQRWRSKLMRPLIHFSTAADLPPEGAGPRKGTDWHLMRPQYMQRGAGGIQINWPDLDDDDKDKRGLFSAREIVLIDRYTTEDLRSRVVASRSVRWDGSSGRRRLEWRCHMSVCVS